jgi:hypothetical protein
LSEWNFGNWAQKTSVTNWVAILQRILAYVVTFPGAVLLVLGLASALGSQHKGAIS